MFSSSLVKCAPEEFPTSRRLFPKHRDSQFDSSNEGFSFSIFRPPFWRRDSEEEESEERKVSADEEKEIWAAVMDRAGDEVSTESVEVTTHDVTAETVTPLKDVQTETPLMTEETSSESTSETATDTEVTSEGSQSEVTSETATDQEVTSEDSQSESTSETAMDLGESSEGGQSETTSTETKLDVEADMKPKAFESSESTESSVSELSDLSVDVHDEKATSTQLEEEPSVTKTEETEVSTSQTEELVDTKKIETKPSSKVTQEESVMRKIGPQTVEVMTSSEPTSRQPPAEVASSPAENKDSHHIGHNLKVVTWTLAGVCLSVVVIGNFLGIYFSYIKPRLHQSALL